MTRVQCKTAELFCSAAHSTTCRLISRLQVTCVRRRHVHHRRQQHAHRLRHRHVHHRLRKRVVRWNGKLLRARERHVRPLPRVRQGVARRLYGLLRLHHRGLQRHHRRALPRRRRNGYGWLRNRRRRDSCRHRRLRSDDRPTRGRSPSLPTGPCPGRCRCRSTPARRSPLANRRRARSRSSRRNKPAECRR